MIKLNFNILEACTIIAPKDNVRYYLNGVLFDKDCVVATDGHRLLKIPHTETIDEPFIVSIEAINNLREQLTPKQRKDSELIISDIYLECCGMVAKFKPVDGKFPGYTRVIPEKYDLNLEDNQCYNWHYMADFQKINYILGGDKELGVQLLPNGLSGALVKFKVHPLVTGVIMPARI